MDYKYDFNVQGYKNLLRAFTEQRYSCAKISGQPNLEGKMYLRHDVDFSPQAALRIGEIEAKMGLFSHFYFLTGSPFYNLFTEQTQVIIQSLADMGHSIALHLDPRPDLFDSLHLQAEFERNLITKATRQPCDSVSLHRPAQSELGLNNVLSGMTACYGKSWFNDIKYCSDSTGRWRYGKPTETQAFKNGQSIQLLTHPIWWYLETESSPEERLNEFLNDRVAGIVKDISDNSSVAFSRKLNSIKI